MKITVKEFVKLDIQGLMQINGGTSTCGNYTQTQPATPPSGGNETNNAPSNNGSDTPSSYSPSYSNGSTTGTSTGTCGGTKTPENPPATGDNPAKDDLGGGNNISPDTGTKVSTGGCSSLNGGNGNGDKLKGKEEDDLPANGLPENTTPTSEQPVNPATPAEPDNPSDSNWNDSFNSDASLYGNGIDLNELPDGLKTTDKITKSESDRLHEDYCNYIKDGWSVIVDHAGYSYGMGNNQKFGDYTVYNLCSPNGEIITQAYDLNNDGVIDYAR